MPHLQLDYRTAGLALPPFTARLIIQLLMCCKSRVNIALSLLITKFRYVIFCTEINFISVNNFQTLDCRNIFWYIFHIMNNFSLHNQPIEQRERTLLVKCHPPQGEFLAGGYQGGCR